MKIHKWSPEQTEKYWDYLNRTTTYYWSKKNAKPLVKIIRPFLKQATSVLDFGCGDGSLLSTLSKEPYFADAYLCGYDSSPSTVASLQNLVPRTSIDIKIISDISSLTNVAHEIGGFDVVFCCEVIEHMYDDQLNQFIDLISKCLKKDGKLILTTPNNEDLAQQYILNPIDQSLFHKWQHVRSWSSSSLSSWLKPYNFTSILIQECNLSHLRDSWIKRLYRRFKYRSLPNLIGVFKYNH